MNDTITYTFLLGSTDGIKMTNNLDTDVNNFLEKYPDYELVSSQIAITTAGENYFSRLVKDIVLKRKPKEITL